MESVAAELAKEPVGNGRTYDEATALQVNVMLANTHAILAAAAASTVGTFCDPSDVGEWERVLGSRALDDDLVEAGPYTGVVEVGYEFRRVVGGGLDDRTDRLIKVDGRSGDDWSYRDLAGHGHWISDADLRTAYRSVPTGTYDAERAGGAR